MDNLYQNSSYPYLPQNNYHQHNNMYRNTPFHIPPMNDNSESTEPYNWSNHHHYPQHHVQPRLGYYCAPPSSAILPSPRPKITTNVWEDEGTVCYQVDAKGICVARRQDNDMINGTKLLNVVGMSRGKRDGILKNEKGRVVVKVGAMHLKGVWIPFSRARELAAKFKIMDVLFPIFAEEPSMYLNLPADAAKRDDVLLNNKCNIVSSPQPVFNHKTCSDEHHNASSSPVGIPANWDRPYQLTPTSSHYDDHPPNQILHRASQSDLQSLSGGSPTPRAMLQTPHANTSNDENNEFYLLNNSHHENQGYDYYNRQLQNRSSFSSLSSHHSYLYNSSFQEGDKTPSYLDHSGCYSKPVANPYTKSSPYTTNTNIQITETTSKPVTSEKSVGSTTPSSWFSPETPTAVLFQHKDKEELTSNNKKRKSSLSIDPTSTKKQAISSPTSPPIRTPKRKNSEI